MKRPMILHVNYGIASAYSDRIEINKVLLEYPKLYKSVLEHEREHMNGAGIELDWNEKFSPELLSVVLRHPSTWVHFLPLWVFIRDGRLAIIWEKMNAIIWATVAFFIFMGALLWS